MSFLKVKAKPMKPRKPKATFELKTTLQSYKRMKVGDDKPIQFNVDPNFKGLGSVASQMNQADAAMAPAP